MHRPPATAGGGRLALALALALTLGLPAGSVAGEAALGMPPALQLDGTSVVLNADVQAAGGPWGGCRAASMLITLHQYIVYRLCTSTYSL